MSAARVRPGSRGAAAVLGLAALGLAALGCAGCDPAVKANPMDRGPAPGPVGGGAALADDGWKPPAAPAMPGLGAMGAGGAGASDSTAAGSEPPLPEAIATGDGRGLPSDGAALYGLLCAKCHGAAGKADGPMAAMVSPGDLSSPAMHARMSDDQIARLIVNGRKKMPAFGPAITMEQLRALVVHVRTLKSG